MTESDWMVLTNRPDVVEKDIIKLLDWFLKEGILLHFFRLGFYMFHPELSIWRDQSVAVQEFLPGQLNGREVG